MVCPPEVGQPGGKTCLAYFREFFPKGLAEVTNDEFKKWYIIILLILCLFMLSTCLTPTGYYGFI